MPSSPEDKPYRRGHLTAGSDHPWMFRGWSAEEWSRIPDGRRPPGAIRLGGVWAEFRYEDRTDSGVPVDTYRPHLGTGGTRRGAETPLDRPPGPVHDLDLDR